MLIALRWLSSRAYAMRDGEGPKTRVGRQLTGRVVGLHGCGFIGKEVVRLLQPFNCEILVHDILDFPEFYRQYNVTPVDFDTLLKRSEVLSLHIPRPPGNDFLYDAKTLARLRPDGRCDPLCADPLEQPLLLPR